MRTPSWIRIAAVGTVGWLGSGACGGSPPSEATPSGETSAPAGTTNAADGPMAASLPPSVPATAATASATPASSAEATKGKGVRLEVSNLCPDVFLYCVVGKTTTTTHLTSNTVQTIDVAAGDQLVARDGSACTSKVLHTVPAAPEKQSLVLCKR